MFRGLALLFALLAQGMTLASPVSFVLCHRAEGPARMEFSGTSCGCHDEVVHVEDHADCGEHHDGHTLVPHPTADMSLESPAADALPCSCVHSAVEMAPQVRSRAGHEVAAQTLTVFTAVLIPAPAAMTLPPRSFFRAAGCPLAAPRAELTGANLRV